jgi:hypothetical protein
MPITLVPFLLRYLAKLDVLYERSLTHIWEQMFYFMPFGQSSQQEKISSVKLKYRHSSIYAVNVGTQKTQKQKPRT